VIDEADRLLAQSFQDWLARVLVATRTPSALQNDSQISQPTFYPQPDTIAPNMIHHLPYPHLPTFLTESPQNSCQKLLFSATLTNDPGKIAALELRDPKYFVVQKSKDTDDQSRVLDIVMEKFSMPSALQVWTYHHLITLKWLMKVYLRKI
jgi:ATP-dependent RNA helicase DDX51/DBP6